MERDFNSGFNPNYMDYNSNINMDMNDPMFNPIMQYEQAFYYYRYLSLQMDYKIKCKEYEKLCYNGQNQDSRNSRRPE